MSFFVIGDEETVIGFRLAGVDGRIAHTPPDALEALKVATATEGVDIILITERMALRIEEEVARYTYALEFPLIVEIPDRHGPLPGRPSPRERVKAAIGIKL